MSIKERSSTSTDNSGKVESPFLDQELFVAESEEEWEPRVAALVAESPFISALEERRSGFDLDQREEEALDEPEGEDEVADGEAREELDEDELTLQTNHEEDESLDYESAWLREDEKRLESPEGFVEGESQLEGSPEYGSDESSLDSEQEWARSELEDDLGPDLERENGSLPPLGKPDFWPDAVYIVKGEKDSFLASAREFHKLWGLEHMEFESFEGLIGLIAKAKSPDKRIRMISHASDGFIIPLFEGSPAKFAVTQKQIEALNAGISKLMDELLGTLVDLDKTNDQGVIAWTDLLVQIESNAPAALKPFGLTSKTRPSGDKGLLLRRCADLVALASEDAVFEKAVRKSIRGARVRLKRSKKEVAALEAAVRKSGIPFTMSLPPKDMKEMIDRLGAAVGALDDRPFRKTLTEARTKLKDKWLDFRGCRIGDKTDYLKALAKFMGVDGCTAPDWFSGYPGTPIRDRQVKSAADFKALVKSTAVEAAMNRWGERAVTNWSSVAAADKPARFFNKFLSAQNGMLPVYEVDYSRKPAKEKHMLFWNSSKGKERWLGSMWDRAPKKRVQSIASKWGAKMPRMATLSLHFDIGSQSSPQEVYVAPDPKFRDHIKEVKKP